MVGVVAVVPAQAGVRVKAVDLSGYPKVRVSVVTSGRTGRPFVAENGRHVAGVSGQNLGDTKSVVLAVDRSQSMRGASFTDAAVAARSFVAAKGGGDRVELVAFGRRAYAYTRFSSSTTDADTALRALTVDGRSGTALYDAIVLSARALAREDLPGRVIIVLTDGRDVSSANTLPDAVRAAHDAGAAVYPIAIAGPDFSEAPLRTLAGATGGTYYRAARSGVLSEIYARIARELARTWRIEYVTAARPGDRLDIAASVDGVGTGRGASIVPGASAAPVPPTGPSVVYRSGVGAVVVGLAAGVLVLLALAFLLQAPQGARLRRRIDPHLGEAGRSKRNRKAEGRAAFQQLAHATERAFGNLRQWRAVERLLERADLPLKAAELLWIAAGSGFVLAFFAVVSGRGPFLILLSLATGALVPLGFVWFKAKKRLKAFENQLPDLLITLAAALKAGHSFRQGIQTIVDEGQQPASTEFKRVLTETRLGRPMDEALDDMSARVGSKNLHFVITAVAIQRQVGGSLAGLFDMVAEAVRQRQQFVRKIKSLTSMGRMSAYTLVGLPFFVAGAATLVNHSYMTPLWETQTGHKLLALGFVMMALGSAVLKKIVSFKG